MQCNAKLGLVRRLASDAMCHGRKQGRMWAKCGRRQVQGKSMAAKSGKSKVRRVSKPKRMDGWPTSVDACGLCAAQDTLAGRQAVGVEGEAAAAAVPLLLLLLLLLMPGPGENWWVLELGLGAGGAEARCEERHRGAVEGFFILLCRFRAARQVERRTPLRRALDWGDDDDDDDGGGSDGERSDEQTIAEFGEPLLQRA